MREATAAIGLAAVTVFLTIVPAALADGRGSAPTNCEWRTVDSGVNEIAALFCLGSSGKLEPIPTPAEFNPRTVAAAEGGDVSAMRTLWLFFYNEGGSPRDEGLYLYWLGRAAEAGDRMSMHRLGVAHARGQSLPVDPAEGLRWIKASAESGYADGMAAYGSLLAVGEGVAVDPQEAVRWFRAAAEQGSVRGMVNLAEAYEQGFGIVRDASAAKLWRERATVFSKRTAQPDESEVSLAYPIEAAAAEVAGAVTLRCRVGDDRYLANCSVTSENPPGWGFAQAALGLAPKVKVLPGLAAGSQIRFPVGFRLEQDRTSQSHADLCAAYSLALEDRGPLTGLPSWWSRYWKARSNQLARLAGSAEGLERLSERVSEARLRLARGMDQGRLRACKLRG